MGLTGSMGMGKSTTAAMFHELGVPVWDADRAVRRLYAKGGEAVGFVAQLAPRAVTDGAVDKERLRHAVATDPSLLPRLEAIVHPLVAAKRAAFVASAREGIVLLDVPLLFENGIDAECDAVAVASASAERQAERLSARGLNPDEIALLLSRQMPDAEKRARADWVIPTETLEGARAAVRHVLDEIRAGRAGEG